MSNRVLVTNDDGIDGEGLRVLVATLVAHDFEPIVVAPDADYSGAGTSLISATSTTFSEGRRELPYERRVLVEAPDVEAYAVGAPPAMCALLAMRGAFGEPADLVASGINFGLNTGPSVRHSGTVSAALTAAGFGVPALAISAEHAWGDHEAPLRFDTAAELGAQLLRVLPDSGHAVLNLNVPRRPLAEIEGVRSAAISTVTSFYSYVEERTDDHLMIGYKLGEDPLPPDSDSALVKAGFAAVTSLVGVSSTVSCDDVIAELGEPAA